MDHKLLELHLAFIRRAEERMDELPERLPFPARDGKLVLAWLRGFSTMPESQPAPDKKFRPEDHDKTWGNGIDRGPTGGDW